MEIKCPDCGKYFDAAKINCPICNKTTNNTAAPIKTIDKTRQCKSCATIIPVKAKICPHCGKKQGIPTKYALIIIIFFAIVIPIGMCQKNNNQNKPVFVPQYIITDKDDVLPKYSMVWKSSINIIHYIDLVSEKNNISLNYFNSLVDKKLAYQTDQDLPVIIVDTLNYHDCSLIKVHVKNGTGEGWVFYDLVKFSKNK